MTSSARSRVEHAFLAILRDRSPNVAWSILRDLRGRHERAVFTAPGVPEALDGALAEVEALRNIHPC